MTTAEHRTRINTAESLDLCRVAKVDESLGLVMGWGLICTENGQPYYDAHNDHLPEAEMLKAATKFMRTKRAAKIMHEGADVGQVVFAFPVLGDVFKAMDLPGPTRTGLIIAWAPDDRALLNKFLSQEWTGFSFGGDAYLRPVRETP